MKVFLKNILMLLLIQPVLIQAQLYNSLNIQLKSIWRNTVIDSITDFGNQRYSGCYGWTDSVSGKNYAILGGTDGTYFIDISDPSHPVTRDYVPGGLDSCTWREYKTYQNYVYMASDDPDSNRFQIADLSFLPDSVHVIHDSDSIIRRSHTLFIDGDKLYCGGLSYADTTAAMAVYSLSNPARPVLLRKLEQDYPFIDYVHDMFVRNDTIYASAGHQGLFMFILQGDSQFVMVGQYSMYPWQGFNHSSYLTENGKYLVFTDEVPAGLPFKVIQVDDFSNISLVATQNSNNYATPHNPYIRDGVLYMASYQDGLWMYDLNNNGVPVLKGYFDTYWQNDGGGFNDPDYAGCWGAYPFYENGIVIASDMQNGLFVLDVSGALSEQMFTGETTSKIHFANPGTGDLNIYFSGTVPEKVGVYRPEGTCLGDYTVDTDYLVLSHSIFPSAGVYLLEFRYREQSPVIHKYIHLK